MLKTWIGFLAVSLVAVGSLLSCDSGDTVASVNYGFDSTTDDVKSAVSTFKIKITSGSRTSETDYPVERSDAGAITSPTYKRITLSGWTGEIDVAVDAVDAGGATLLSASQKAQLSEHSAVAVFVKFTRMVPDAGAPGGGGSSGSGGSGSGGSGSGGSGSGGGVSGSGGSGSGGSGSGGSGSADAL